MHIVRDNKLAALILGALTIAMLYRFPIGAGQVRYSFELAFRAMIGLGVAGVVFKYNRWVSMFLVLALFSQFWPLFESASARAFYNVLAGVILYVVLIEYVKPKSMMDLMIVVCVANLVFATLQLCGVHLIWQGSGSITGLMENPNSLSATMALCLPAFLRYPKWLFLPIFGLILSGSSGGMAAGLGGLVVYAYMTYRFWIKLVIPVLLVGVASISLFDIHASFDIRMEAWSRAFQLFIDHPVFGCGLGRWKEEFIALALAKQFPEGFIRLHSTILQSTLEMGVGFLIVLTGYVVGVVRSRPGAIALSALTIILINGSVNFLIRIGPNAILVIMWLSIIWTESKHIGLTQRS